MHSSLHHPRVNPCDVVQQRARGAGVAHGLEIHGGAAAHAQDGVVRVRVRRDVFRLGGAARELLKARSSRGRNQLQPLQQPIQSTCMVSRVLRAQSCGGDTSGDKAHACSRALSAAESTRTLPACSMTRDAQ